MVFIKEGGEGDGDDVGAAAFYFMAGDEMDEFAAGPEGDTGGGRGVRG